MIKKEKVAANPVIKDDILRYKKNKFAGNFALLALVFNCLYFMLLYAIHEPPVKTALIGASVIVNLLVLLIGFFCSEGIKNYNRKFSIVLFVLGAVQVARIFIYPTMGMAGGWLHSEHVFGITIKSTTASVGINGALMIAFLSASAACFIVSGVFGLIIAQRLENFKKKVEAGEVSVEETLAKLDEEEEMAKAAQAAQVAQPAQTEQVSTESADTTVSSGEADNG